MNPENGESKAAPDESNRRFTIALTAAVAATTVAIGVTAATLLGWFRPAGPPQPARAPAEPSLVYVPIAPAPPPDPVPAVEAAPTEQLAMQDRREHDDDEREEREHDDD